jgi:hypothetical protein
LLCAAADEDEGEVDGDGLLGEAQADVLELGEEGFAYAADADDGDEDLLGGGHCDLGKEGALGCL